MTLSVSYETRTNLLTAGYIYGGFCNRTDTVLVKIKSRNLSTLLLIVFALIIFHLGVDTTDRIFSALFMLFGVCALVIVVVENLNKRLK